MSQINASAFNGSVHPRDTETGIEPSRPVLTQDRVAVDAERHFSVMPPVPEKKKPHESYLDALRGLAFLGVLTVHASFTVPNLPPHISHLALYGRFGVQLFFVVSAFTLMLSSRSRVKREDSSTLKFFVRRLCRIAPLYWTGLVFYTIADGVSIHGGELRCALPHGIGWWQILTNLTFIHGLFPTTINSAVPGGWSIAAEMIFYLIFPALLLKVTNIRRATLLTSGALLLALVAKHVLFRVANPAWLAKDAALGDFLTYWFPAHFCVFTEGILLYFVVEIQKNSAWFRARNNRRSASLALVAASLILLLRLLRYDTFLHLPVQFVFGVAFVLLAAGLSLVPWKVFVNRAFCRLGLISFSCYIWHFFALRMATLLVLHNVLPWSCANPAIRFISIWAVTLLGTLSAASLSFRFIETPGIALGRRIIASLEKRAPMNHTSTGGRLRMAGRMWASPPAKKSVRELTV